MANKKPNPEMIQPIPMEKSETDSKTMSPTKIRNSRPAETRSLTITQRPNHPRGKARIIPKKIKKPIKAPISV